MSSAFLVLCGGDASKREALVQASSRWLPFEAESEVRWAGDAQGAPISARCWGAFDALARGAWADDAGGGWSCFDGELVDDAPLTTSIGAFLHQRLRRQGVGALNALEGGWVIAHIDARGEVWGAIDGCGTQHLYYGERDGICAISNRAMLVASALHGGELPAPDPSFYAWWLTRAMAPLRPHLTPWASVQALSPTQRVCWRDGALRLEDRERALPYASWDEAREAFAARAARWTRAPGVRAQLALTGGKDSRAVLAGLIASGAHERLEGAFVRALPGHVDVEVAASICARLGLSLRHEGIEAALDEPLLERMRAHLMRTEGFLHAWDVKAARSPAPRVLTLNGHFGECYRSHFTPRLLKQWPGIVRWMTRHDQINEHDVLSARSDAQIRAQTLAWCDDARGRGVRWDHAKDQWHRECRMWQWASDIQRGDGVSGGVSNPLASARLLAGYDRQTLLERRAELTHFALMGAGPKWLREHPFANATWRRELLPWSRQRAAAPVVRPTWPAYSRQRQVWARYGAEATSYLLERGDDAFYEVFDHAGVRALLARYEASGEEGVLKGIFGLLGARIAIREGFSPRPVRLAPE